MSAIVTEKVSPAEALAYNCMMIEKVARRMAHEVKRRTETGDIMLVCQACEWLSGSAGNLIEFFGRCDAERWLEFIMVSCGGRGRTEYGGRSRSELLKIATGKSREQWLDFNNRCLRHPLAPY